MNTPTADFLGHEAVHVISTSVVGKTEFTVYNANARYDDSNEFERAGYLFGGAFSNGFSIKKDQQILKQNKGWWRK